MKNENQGAEKRLIFWEKGEEPLERYWERINIKLDLIWAKTFI